AKKHIFKALELEPNHALVHAFMAEHYLFAKDFEKSMFHANKAIELNPTLPDGYSYKAYVLSVTGNTEEAVPVAEISMQIDPYHYYMGWNAGEVYRNAGQFERAIDAFRSIPLLPASILAEITTCQLGLGQLDEAKSTMAEYRRIARQQMPNFPASVEAWRSLWDENEPFESSQDSDAFFDLLLQAGLCNDIDSQDDIPSIAVLPFENMSGDPQQEYFSDGITASIILSLGLFHGIGVKSQKSSFAFRQSSLSSVEIAGELKADYLVEGSIRKSSSRVRVSVQLIESASGNQIWGKQYDAELEDILELEQELSQSIAATISGRLGHKIQQSAVRKPAKDMKSYDYLMRGLYHFGLFTCEDMVIAREQIQKCIDIDPDNAIAHTNLALAYDVELLENWASDRNLAENLAGRHFEIALQLEPDDALTHAYLTEHLIFLGDFEKAEFHADRAIELNPTASEGYVAKADLLSYSRRAGEAIHYADLCMQLDPHSVGSGWVAGDVYRNSGQYRKAIKTFRSISHPPPSIQGLIAVSFVQLELLEEARTEMKLYQKLAKQQMPKYPSNTEEWRQLWGQSAHYLFRDDFNAFFTQLLQAGLCDDLEDADSDLPSIAVLPFENMSGDPEQAHFSDGITTDIIATLSRFNHMRTVSRYSVLQYKDQHVSIPEIAQQQNVRYILEGSVRKSSDSIRVSAELIDSTDQKICWSERFDRDLNDLFKVQDEIAMSIALAMKVHLDDGDMASHRSVGTTNVRAWELVMAAVDLQDTYIRENIIESRGMARQAIELDPGYAYAWVCLAWTYWQEIYCGWSDSIDAAMNEATQANQQAHEINPEYSEAWSQAALIHMMNHDANKTIASCSKAIELEPGNAEVQALMAFCLIFTGDYEQARMHNRGMLKLCPVLPNWYYLIDGQIEQLAGDLVSAIDTFKQGVAIEPDSPLCRFYLIHALMQQGDEAAAKTLAQEIRVLDKNVTGKGLVRAFSIDEGLRKQFQVHLEKFDLY
ncbi:MAG: hypothetical protein GY935_19135, partial [Gammaproteobacteria bacterium]|nr:hypothetical protein [Gammaproteobacteria bacterium]